METTTLVPVARTYLCIYTHTPFGMKVTRDVSQAEACRILPSSMAGLQKLKKSKVVANIISVITILIIVAIT